MKDEALRMALAVQPVAKIVPCYTPSGKRVALNTEYQHLPIGTDLYTTPPAAQQTCNCRWEGEVQVQQCTLHQAHVDAIHEWAGRAKAAEAKLAAQPAVPDAFGTREGEHPQYVQGWNDCRAEMLKGMK